MRRGPGGQVSPFCFPTVRENPVLLCSMCPWAWGPRSGLGGLQAILGNPSPSPALRSLPTGPHGALERQLGWLPEQGACGWVHHGGGGEELVPAHGQGGQVQLLQQHAGHAHELLPLHPPVVPPYNHLQGKRHSGSDPANATHRPRTRPWGHPHIQLISESTTLNCSRLKVLPWLRAAITFPPSVLPSPFHPPCVA